VGENLGDGAIDRIEQFVLGIDLFIYTGLSIGVSLYNELHNYAVYQRTGKQQPDRIVHKASEIIRTYMAIESCL
jgi:hypothetical protein